MAGDTQKTWPLRCPECGECTRIELPPKAEAGLTGTTSCLRGHPFIYQYDGIGVDVVGGRHVRGRHRGGSGSGGPETRGGEW